MMGLKIIYLANILVAGWISISSLFFPKTAQVTVFSGDFEYSEAIRLIRALWLAIFNPMEQVVQDILKCGL